MRARRPFAKAFHVLFDQHLPPSHAAHRRNSRHAFPENCPWEMGPEDHLQVDLANAQDTRRAIAEVKDRLAVEGGVLHALVNNAGISPKGEGGSRMGTLDTR